MAARVTNVEQILDPWMATEPDADKRVAVLNALHKASDDYLRLFDQLGHGHPLKRLIEVPEAGVAITVLLTHPNVGIHLLSIDRI